MMALPERDNPRKDARKHPRDIQTRHIRTRSTDNADSSQP